MEWQAWRPTYEEIVADFGYDVDADAQAAHRLRAILGQKDGFRNVGTELKHRPAATVVGCGPALETVRPEDFPEGVVVACDGATQRLQELEIVPRIVVTDLDGEPDALRWAAGEGAAMVIHAHGDNQEKMQDLVPDLQPFRAGTYQSAPQADLAPLRNLGGFTDGDRAVLLCEAMDVRQVNLLAFDFEAAPSRYSHQWDPATKGRKLAWAERIIAGVQARGRTLVRHWVP